eukprot:GHVL01044130.1.p1 GENE.GHVL01044130.1~~GHVL01044130.1.p1  ORF type:complete len:321 (+),score=62.74 GHVL01044130.1:432-1394(+)
MNILKHKTSAISRSIYQQSCNISKCLGFVGIGNMGKNMAKNLIMKTDHEMFIMDQNPLNISELTNMGAQECKSMNELFQRCDVIFTMLPNTKIVRNLYFDSDDYLVKKSDSKSILFIECSTIDPVQSKEINEIVRSRGHMMVDSPVSGGVPGATNGTLTFMVGGTAQNFEMAKEYLRHMGAESIHCGDAGSGHAVKVCNNLILGASMIGVSEGYRLAEDLGVDTSVFNKVVNSSSGRCWVSDSYNPVPGVMQKVPASRAYSGGFSVDFMLKDLKLALAASEKTKSDLPLTKMAADLYEDISEDGKGFLDFGYVFKHKKEV